MPQPSLTKLIIPFEPRSFPPRNIGKRTFDPILKKANRALKEYRDALRQTPHSAKLLTHLATLEAIDSLESQNIPITLNLFLGKPKRELIAEQNHDYMDALAWASCNIAYAPFSKRQICRVHHIVKRATAPQEDLGRYRKRQNWIGPSNCTIDKAYFYPPEPAHVQAMMEGLFEYMGKKEKDPLLQIAIAFAQLLIIHPFMDGNGRIARIWVPIFLFKKKVLPAPIFFLSSYFKKYRLIYFQTLFQTTENNNWEHWIAFFLKGVIRESNRSRKALKKISALFDELRLEHPRRSQKMLLFLFQQPIFSHAGWKKAKGSLSLLQELKKGKWVSEAKRGVLHFVPLLKILRQLQKQ